MNTTTIILCVVIAIVVLAAGGAAGFFAGFSYRKKTAEAQIGSAEAEATRLVNEAIKTATQKKKEAILEAKDEVFRMKAEVDAQKAEADKEIRQRSGYQELNQEAHAGLDAHGGRAQGQSALAKLNTRMGIGLRTMADRSTRNLAEMLAEGSSQGVMDCIKCQRDYPNAAPGTKDLMRRLQAFQEANRLKLEQFL